jgi:hypothetical protein
MAQLFNARGEEKKANSSELFAAKSTPSVVPNVAFLATPDNSALEEQRSNQESEMLPLAVQMKFPGGGKQPNVGNDLHFFPTSAGIGIESLTEFQFFSDIELRAEPAQFPKHTRLTKNKGAGSPFPQTAG